MSAPHGHGLDGATETLRALLDAEGLDPAFPEHVLAEVEALLSNDGIDDPALLDLTGLPFVTIDHETSRDLDQAVHITTSGSGFVVRYALADASHYVRPGRPLFDEALRRGASYYLPGLCVPMLPTALSEGVVSLNPEVPRRALVFVMSLDSEARCTRTRIVRCRIRSRAKLSFSGVQRYYDDPTGSELRGRDFAPCLELLRRVGELRIEEARSRNVISLEREDIAFEVGDGGRELRARLGPRLAVERYNEQISLLCNTEGARFLGTADGRVQPVYRVHDAPPQERLDQLAAFIRRIVSAHGLPPSLSFSQGTESLADYLERLQAGGAEAGPRVRQALERQIMYTFERSLFSSEPGRHYALAVDGYARFSSPMREVAGIFTHKEALEKLSPAAACPSRDEDERLRDKVIEAANRSKEQQKRLTRLVHKLAMDQLFAADLIKPRAERPLRPGTILGLQPTRLYVQLDDPPIEVKVYVMDMERLFRHGFDVRDGGAALAGRGRIYRVGDAVRIENRGHDDRRNRWRLVPS